MVERLLPDDRSTIAARSGARITSLRVGTHDGGPSPHECEACTAVRADPEGEWNPLIPDWVCRASVAANFESKAKRCGVLQQPLIVVAVKHAEAETDDIDVGGVLIGQLADVSGRFDSMRLAN